MARADTADELRELSRLGFAALRDAAGGIGAVHAAIAGRVFAAVGPTPVQPIHDRVARLSYGAVRAGLAVSGQAADAALARRDAGDGRGLSASPRGGAVVAAVTGLHGDALEAAGSPLAAPMAVMRDGRPVALERESFPGATGAVVVFVHGLMETELAWGTTYTDRLRERGMTPVVVRYNSGRRVAANGRSLSALLEALVAAWPVPVLRLALVGHSMGGLVAHAAHDAAAAERHAWPGLARHTVSLGSPHLGAPLAQAAHVADAALRAVPETRPLGGWLARRSAGIHDLRHGLGAHPRSATHHAVTATVTRDPRHPVGRLVGDGLVLTTSAAGAGGTVTHVGGASHFALLRHPDVAAALCRWLP